MPAADYECIVSPMAKGMAYWSVASNRQTEMAKTGVAVFTSLTGTNSDDEDSDIEEQDFEKYMAKHGVPLKKHDSSSTESPTGITCSLAQGKQPVPIQRTQSAPVLKRPASAASIHSKTSSKRSVYSAGGGSSMGSSAPIRRGVSVQRRYRPCLNA